MILDGAGRVINLIWQHDLMQVEQLIQENYGIVGSISQLPGERDLNFKLDSPDGVFIFKVHNVAERDFIELQQKLLEKVSTLTQLTEPKPIPAKNGQLLINLPDEKIGRLLTWSTGELLSAVEITAELKQTLGSAVALVDHSLADFDSKGFESILSRPFGWNALQVNGLMANLSLIKNSEINAEVREVFDLAVESLLPDLRNLPAQIIHNDANDNNIVVQDGRVNSLIDFGDIILAPKICGLAVACAYVITNLEDPISDILPVVRGYHLVSPLSSTELNLLFGLIKLRIATSITMAATQYTENPENEYLLISQEKFENLIKVLNKTDPNLALYRVRNACGFEANPNSRAIRQYLSSGRAKICDVVLPPLSEVQKIWLNWASDNPEIPRQTEQIFALMKEAKADLAIGHYCENRLVYEGEAFAIESPARRKVHLGVDLFAPAGTPVYAALDGVIEYFNDNNAHLDYGPVIILRHQTDTGLPFFTLYGHLSRPSLENLSVGKKISAGDLIATMGEEFENVGWPPHTHFQLLTDLCGMGLDIYGVAPLIELPVWRSISPNPNLCLRIREGTDAHTHLPTEVLAQERQVVMSRALSLNFKEPIEIVSGQGAYLYDRSGRPFLDLVNNVAHVGHSHPRVVAAGQKQMALLNTNTRYLNQNAIEYARALASTFPDPLNIVFFVNSGSEANDLALRLAQAHTKAKGMIVLDHAYHGHITSIIDISPYKFAGKGGAGKPDHVQVVPTPDSYKGIHRGVGAGEKYATEFTKALAELNQPLCAFISESIISTAGQITLADGFLKSAYQQAHAAGGVCIADEVQIGMGRVGEHFWGFELHGVTPDIVTIGKPIGNGHPLAAVVTTPEIAQSFLTGMEYFNTFGGNPVSAAIGQAVLDVVSDQALQANALNMGNYLMNSVRDLASEISTIGDVRGSGLFIGVELVKGGKEIEPATKLTADLIEYAKSNGVFLSSDGPANNVLKIKPPLVITKSDVDLFLTVFKAGLLKN
jgi:4-aminobutyrate aminotransferase-like enzyme/Ser/Thr protein kinase RdoA (MazF antagonist)